MLQGNRRETRLLGILSFVHSTVWKVLFGKVNFFFFFLSSPFFAWTTFSSLLESINLFSSGGNVLKISLVVSIFVFMFGFRQWGWGWLETFSLQMEKTWSFGRLSSYTYGSKRSIFMHVISSNSISSKRGKLQSMFNHFLNCFRCATHSMWTLRSIFSSY